MLICIQKFVHLIFGHSLDYLFLLSGIMIQNLLTRLVICFEKSSLSPLIAKKVLLQKITIFIMISLAHGVDYLLDKNDILRNATICFYIANEALQTLEQATQIHILVPTKLKETIQHLLNNEEENEHD
ncbi:phage holin family protein [Vagococcus zengguangii]|uniref:Uncharacterized protein n=1 Tax=Vagococcus zengguangii TaxID=2571750 RepID=A0A4D7CZK7_9ENTE|nr:phage holin family protein [Vagococcus zengguangii]QCI86996.1 hypothetical protein FA707_08460 [Vagococcus zengguangii]TLG80962.1 hypothetical protein FE258_03500 [Vagococcus zengguangii]